MKVLALALIGATVAIVALMISRRRDRARAMVRLQGVVRTLGLHLAREWEFVTVEKGCIVLKSGERLSRIPILTAFERLEGAAPSEITDRVRWLVRHGELHDPASR